MREINLSELKNEREKMGKTLAQVSSDMGLSLSLLCKLENGQASLTKENAERISNYYNVLVQPKKVIKTFVDYEPSSPKYKKMYQEANRKIKELERKIAICEKRFEQIKSILNIDCNVIE